MHWLFGLLLPLGPKISVAKAADISGDYANPIVYLGAAGVYRGILQNNGT
jgi:hypothetical protein